MWHTQTLRLVAIFLAATALGLPSDTAPSISQAEYKERRDKLRKAAGDAVFILFGEPTDDEKELRAGFFQEPNFLYLTGWREPDAALLLAPGREILFLPHHRKRLEVFTGKRWSAEDDGVPAASGIDTVLPIEKLESELARALETAPRLLAFPRHPLTERLKPLAPLRNFEDAGPEIARLRMRKSPAEIAMLQRSMEASIAAQRAAWKKAVPGNYEYQVAAAFTAAYLDSGCARPAYSPIAGSGPNSTVLHYMANRRRMDRGETLVLDAAAECAGYAADLTRTLPVGGTFTPRQRELYDVVLGAQKAALAAMKPGMTMMGREAPNSLARIAFEYINTHGKDLKGQPLGKYFTHGLGHPVGLDVHDVWTGNAPLAAGMVVTLEPGIYIPEENIGIRIEDMVLVTENGARLLSGALPREAAGVEKAMAAGADPSQAP
jgi:Xaa-Pro aminopeptidase